jgi:hypothetical protein
MAGGGNWEFQLYRNNRTNSFVEDGVGPWLAHRTLSHTLSLTLSNVVIGVLHIRPTLTEDWLPSPRTTRLDMCDAPQVTASTGGAGAGPAATRSRCA